MDAMLNEYLYWNGRYIANVFVLINPMVIESLRLYQSIPILFILLTILGFYFLLKTIVGPIESPIKLWIMSMLMSLTYIFQLPIISEGYYHYNGAVTYILPNIFTLFYLTLILLFFKKRYFFSKQIHGFSILLLQFIIVGFNEVHMLLICLFQLVLAIIEIKKKNNGIGILLLLSAISFSSIMVFSPGNFVRSSHFYNNYDLMNSGISSILQMIRFSSSWISSAPILLISILYIPFHFRLCKTSPLFQKSFYLNPYISLLLLFSTIFLASFAPYWTTGILGQHRTLNTAWFFFLILWFINLSVWCNYFKITLCGLRIPKTLQNILYCLIWLTITFTQNGYNAAIDIYNGTAQKFDESMSNRLIIMQNARTSDNNTIYFNTIADPPKTIFVLDISKDENHWANTTYPLYFGIPEKKVKPKIH